MTRRETLTREKVLSAAMTLVDEEGLEGLSMRRLAATLDVHVMSLYNHVSNKADLLDGIAENVFAQVELPAPGLPWPEQVRALALSMYRAFSRHPAVPVALVTDQANPASVRALEPFDRLAGALYQAGLDDRRARQGLGAITSLVMGSLLVSTAGFTGDPSGHVSETNRSAYLRRIDPDRLPNVGRLLRQRTADDPSPPEDFEQALDMLLRGLMAAADQP
ncbi:MAG TPA: TetR/AcrR family transcriptional regulator C-terminal domain-containing protein [Candidatus Dormibacteraeota bacterium]|jgi:AcrR family transcriptional regulator|nr:TetR/AcrR family transcriptional regulator C-terminal domain-containing protein [Candidatus Dormibacteraeota bacterium]